MNKNVLIIISLVIIFFASCKQQEKIIGQKFHDIIAEEELEKLIFKGNTEIKTVKLAKINFEININDETYQSGGNIAIIKDSIIIISLVPLMGYEIAKIFCFKNNILIMDRQNKTYYYTPYTRNIGEFNLNGDFNELESILTGRAFIYEKRQDNDKMKRNILREDGYLKYFFELKEGDFVRSKQEIKVRTDNLLTERNEISDNRNQFELCINYGQLKTIDYFVLPHEIDINVNNTKDKVNININIGNIIINEIVNANVIIPEKYEEIMMD